MKQSIISLLETDYRASLEALFDRLYPANIEQNIQQQPGVKLQYMVEDYKELICGRKPK